MCLQHPSHHFPPPRSGDAGKAQPTNHCFNAKQMLVPGMKQLKIINFLSAFRGKKPNIFLPANVQFHVFSRPLQKYFIEAAVYSIIWLITV